MRTLNRNKLVCQKMEELLETIKESPESNEWKEGQLTSIITIFEDELDSIKEEVNDG